jgi:hypothetical protein
MHLNSDTGICQQLGDVEIRSSAWGRSFGWCDRVLPERDR